MISQEIIDKVYLNYKYIYDNDDFYYPHDTKNFSRLDGRRVNQEYQDEFKIFKAGMIDNLKMFKSNLKDFCDYVRTYYLEVDIDKYF